MKKILFLENRLRTYVWQWMADFLEDRGYEIYWIVENHYYKPKGKNVFVIPYPKDEDIEKAKKLGIPKDIFDYVTFTDRNLYIFDCKNADYYYHYYNQIRDYLLDVLPDLVIGECTQFYELLAISVCKQENILYLHPSTCRYPVDRFSFYQYDTLRPYKGSGDVYPYDEALNLANSIVSRSILPIYMVEPSFSWKRFLETQKDKLIKTYCYYCGEHYCTPSPKKKLRFNNKRDKLVEKWNALSKNKPWEDAIKHKFVVMYPMHMQPEANLDVWGYPFRNQADTIKKIADQLKDDEILVVKPNPKAKYELTDELLSLLASRDNIVTVPLETPMAIAFGKTGLVVTVTGTIAMECIVSNKPVVTLVKTLNNNQRNCPYLNDLLKLRPFIDKAKNGEFIQISDDERVAYINEIVKTSYKGSPYTTSYDEGMANALLDVLVTV